MKQKKKKKGKLLEMKERENLHKINLEEVGDYNVLEAALLPFLVRNWNEVG